MSTSQDGTRDVIANMDENARVAPASAGTSASPASTPKPKPRVRDVLQNADQMDMRGTPAPVKAAFRRMAESAIEGQVVAERTNRLITELMVELDKERVACGYTMRRLAAAGGIKWPRYLEAYRNGTAIPSTKTIQTVAKVLGIELPPIPQLCVSRPHRRL